MRDFLCLYSQSALLVEKRFSFNMRLKSLRKRRLVSSVSYTPGDNSKLVVFL